MGSTYKMRGVIVCYGMLDKICDSGDKRRLLFAEARYYRRRWRNGRRGLVKIQAVTESVRCSGAEIRPQLRGSFVLFSPLLRNRRVPAGRARKAGRVLVGEDHRSVRVLVRLVLRSVSGL